MSTRTFTERQRERNSAPLTVSRRDISMYEEGATSLTNGFERTYWCASLDGRLSTGEQVSLSRSGDTFTAALTSLETAIKNEGWSIR